MKKDSTMTRDEVDKELDNAFEKCGSNDQSNLLLYGSLHQWCMYE